jgi:hypothetical protein
MRQMGLVVPEVCYSMIPGGIPVINYLGAVSTFNGKLIILDELEIGGQNDTPANASTGATPRLGRPPRISCDC